MGAAAVPLIVMGAGAAYSAYSQYQAGQRNKLANEIMANDAIVSAQPAESAARARGTQVASGITAGAAGANLDVSRGSPVDVAGGSRMWSALDAAMIRANALRTAYGYRVRGAYAEAEGENAAKSTLLTGAANIISGGYKAGIGQNASDLPTFVRGAPYGSYGGPGWINPGE